MLKRRPGAIRENDQSPSEFYCQRHPRYMARRKPTGTCQYCNELYVLKKAIYAHLGAAAGKLSDLLGVDVEVTADLSPWIKFGTHHGTSTSSISIKVSA